MAKRAPAKKAPAKRKPRPKKPPVIELSEFSPETLIRLQEILDAKLNPEKIKLHDPTDYGEPVDITSWIPVFLKYVATLLIGAGIGVYAAGGIPIGPDPGPNRDDVLQQCYEADRISQAKILREYAAKGFANDTAGRLAATEWFNNNRFRNRATDFRPYTTAVVDNFAAGTLTKFADELEGK